MTTPVIPPDEEELDEAPETEPDEPLWKRLLGGSEHLDRPDPARADRRLLAS